MISPGSSSEISIFAPVSSTILLIVFPPGPITSLILSGSILMLTYLGAYFESSGRGSEISSKILSMIYMGKVMRIMSFGAFIEILPGKEGLLHISKMAKRRIDKVEDVMNIGDEVEVKVTEIDSQNRINLVRTKLD